MQLCLQNSSVPHLKQVTEDTMHIQTPVYEVSVMKLPKEWNSTDRVPVAIHHVNTVLEIPFWMKDDECLVFRKEGIALHSSIPEVWTHARLSINTF